MSKRWPGGKSKHWEMQLDPQTLSREAILFPLSSSDHLEESAAQPSKRALSPRGSTWWEGWVEAGAVFRPTPRKSWLALRRTVKTYGIV